MSTADDTATQIGNCPVCGTASRGYRKPKRDAKYGIGCPSCHLSVWATCPRGAVTAWRAMSQRAERLDELVLVQFAKAAIQGLLTSGIDAEQDDLVIAQRAVGIACDMVAVFQRNAKADE